MTKTLRFFTALWTAKAVWLLMKILRRNATHFPGEVALKIDPLFLKHVAKPPTIIVVTGTNGKTSVTNLIVDTFTKANVKVMHNALGSNLTQGIASSLVQATSIFNQALHQTGVLEVDERSSRLILPYIHPKFVIVNNLYRDSYRRNAHVDFIIDILRKSIPTTAHVIVNGDDMFALSVIEKRNHTVFSLAPVADEKVRSDSRIHDAKLCPRCFSPLTFTFYRYHHISHFNCTHCEFTNPKSDVVATMSSQYSDLLELQVNGHTFRVHRPNPSINDAYNVSAVIGLLVAMNKDVSMYANYLSSVQTVASRFNETLVGNKRIVGLLAKDQNPVANSRICDFITTQKHWGRIGLCFMYEVFAHDANPYEVENVAFIYDVDFEYLNECNVTQIMLGGHRRFEFKSRLLLANCSPDTIRLVETEDDEIDAIDINKVDTIVLLYSTKNIDNARMLTQKLAKRIENEVQI